MIVISFSSLYQIRSFIGTRKFGMLFRWVKAQVRVSIFKLNLCVCYLGRRKTNRSVFLSSLFLPNEVMMTHLQKHQKYIWWCSVRGPSSIWVIRSLLLFESIPEAYLQSVCKCMEDTVAPLILLDFSFHPHRWRHWPFWYGAIQKFIQEDSSESLKKCKNRIYQDFLEIQFQGICALKIGYYLVFNLEEFQLVIFHAVLIHIKGKGCAL